jgi:hypothetical protein
MIVRAKFQVNRVSEILGSNGSAKIYKDGKMTDTPVREIQMSAVYGGSEENKSFADATPSGQINFQLNNAACAEEFKVGDTYYVEFERVVKPLQKSA